MDKLKQANKNKAIYTPYTSGIRYPKHGGRLFLNLLHIMPVKERTKAGQRLHIERLKREHGLTEKQARFVDLSLEAPELPIAKKARAAGYSVKAAQNAGYKRLKTPRIIEAITLENKKTLEEEMKEYDEDPRAFVKKSLLAHTRGEVVIMAEHRLKALELMGKMTGEFKERQIIDIGEETRRNMARRLLEE